MGAYIRVGNHMDVSKNDMCEGEVTMCDIEGGQKIKLMCDLRGRYISIHINGNTKLTLCEVEAYISMDMMTCDMKKISKYFLMICSIQVPFLLNYLCL